jgi:hypothetical protein
MSGITWGEHGPGHWGGTTACNEAETIDGKPHWCYKNRFHKNTDSIHYDEILNTHWEHSTGYRPAMPGTEQPCA